MDMLWISNTQNNTPTFDSWDSGFKYLYDIEMNLT